MIEQASNYDDWAWLYNQTLGPKYGNQKIGPIERVVLPHVPPGGAILDLCCGTGQLVAGLTGRGYSVTGFDGSTDMLRFAKQNAPSATFVEGDARHFAFDEAFDAVICTSASLNHMDHSDDLRGVFTSVNRSLKTGGIFVFDVNHPAQMSRYWRGQPAEGEIGRDHAWLITPDYETATARGSFTVDIYRRRADSSNGLLKRLESRLANLKFLRRHRLRLLSRYRTFRPDWEHRSIVNIVRGHDLDTIGHLLRENGFEYALHGTGGGAVDDSNSAYFFCRKIAGVDTPADNASPEAAQ